MIDTVLRYTMLTRSMDQTLERTANDPMTKRETEYYEENIRNIKSIEDFLEDDRIYNYAMKAMGLEDMTYAKGMMRKALKEGVSDPSSFSNQLVDTRFKEFAETFDFAAFGEAATAFDKAQTEITEKYVQQTLEATEGIENNGVRLALYFERKAPEINSAYDILADRALYEVVKTVAGIPDSMVGTDVDRQAAYINKKLKVEDFKEPEKLAKFMEKFIHLYDAINGLNTSPTIQLFAPSSFGINPDTLEQVNSIKFGG
ncbi:DUF1217 domain-containing protein [Pseudovibrio sp. Ad37]|uniref:DUF1217 domain-containing protein n=1 Tax=Pseudovibrio sp. Ad37 TaxID=989422 RepID=UPI0007AE899F|nr:DUF1217 domain-containing protein [Pseudovibrio sp. Ad37]KZL24844.1 hypothetical protein PsAD37_02503 [Pseudovibrio sp. Ad37]